MAKNTPSTLSPLFFFLLLLALAAYGQQERVAVINTVDDRDSIGFSELAHLTDRLRETAANVLPKQRYGIMTTESIVAFLGSQERAQKECRESSCLAELGRKVNADYVAQGHIGRFDGNLTIKTELYSSKSGVMIASFTGSSKNISGLLATIDKKAPILFKKMLDTPDSISKPKEANIKVFVTGTESILSKKTDIIVSGLQAILNDNNVRMTENKKEANYILKIDADVCNLKSNSDFHYANACVKIVLTNTKNNVNKVTTSITGPKEGGLSAENAGEKALRSAVSDVWDKIKDKILGDL